MNNNTITKEVQECVYCGQRASTEYNTDPVCRKCALEQAINDDKMFTCKCCGQTKDTELRTKEPIININHSYWGYVCDECEKDVLEELGE